MLALALYREGLCQRCSQPLSESTSHHEHGPEYVVDRITCRACAELLSSQRAAAEEDQGKGDNGARLWRVHKI